MVGRFRVATAAGLVALAACAEPATESQRASSPSTASAADRSASTPVAPAPKRPPPAPGTSIKILTPKAGSTVHGSTVEVSVLVTSFNIVNRQFHAPVAGEGHVHFYLDAKALPRTHTYPSPVTYRSISGTTYGWTGVSPGRHTFAVQLVGNDHVPLRPAAKNQVTVTVQ
jgi:hypothetical protein